MTIFSTIKRRAVTSPGGRVFLLGMLAIFSHSAWALPPAPAEANPVDPNNCGIYAIQDPANLATSGIIGPLDAFSMRTPLLTATFANNLCAENAIDPTKGNVRAPSVDNPSYLLFNTVALLANFIHIYQGNSFLETHTPDAASLVIDANVGNPPPVATRFFDINAGSFTGPGVVFPTIVPSLDPAQDLRCGNKGIFDIFPDGVASPDFGGRMGPWRDARINASCILNFVPGPAGVPLKYTFASLLNGGGTARFIDKPDGALLSVEIASWMRNGHNSRFNQENEPNVIVSVGGTDGQPSPSGLPNPNGPGVTTGLPITFLFGGDGALNACHFFVPIGTAGAAGAAPIIGRFLVQNFQRLGGGGTVSITHPDTICADVNLQCACIDTVSCDGDNLVFEGSGFANVSIGGVYLVSTAAAAVNPANPTASASGSVLTATGPGVVVTPTTISVPVASFDAAAGDYFPSFSCPEVNGIPLGFSMITGVQLQTDGTSCLLVP